MTPFLALALLLAPATATRDDGAEGCLAYGIYTDVVAVDGDTSFTVPAAPDGYDVTAVVIGDQSDPVQHEVVAPAVSGDIITVGYYIDHVHVCLAQTPPPEESWPATTAWDSPTTTVALSPSSSTAVTPAPTTPAPSSTSTFSPTPSSTTTTSSSSTTTSVNAAPTNDCLEDEPCYDCRTMGNRRCGKALPVTGMSERKVELVPCDDPVLAWFLYGEHFMMRQADGSARYFMRAEYARTTKAPPPAGAEGGAS